MTAGRYFTSEGYFTLIYRRYVIIKRGDCVELFDIFKSKQFEELFENALEREMNRPQNENEILCEIKNCFFMIFSLLHVTDFNSFRFIDYDDRRRVMIDGNEYDFNNEFNHNDNNATEILCTIDCLMANLKEDNIEVSLRKLEKMLNSHLQN